MGFQTHAWSLLVVFFIIGLVLGVFVFCSFMELVVQ